MRKQIFDEFPFEYHIRVAKPQPTNILQINKKNKHKRDSKIPVIQRTLLKWNAIFIYHNMCIVYIISTFWACECNVHVKSIVYIPFDVQL